MINVVISCDLVIHRAGVFLGFYNPKECRISDKAVRLETGIDNTAKKLRVGVLQIHIELYENGKSDALYAGMRV